MKTWKWTNYWEDLDSLSKKLELNEGEKVTGALPIYVGVRDFDPTHSYSCDSVREKISEWRIGAFIETSKRLTFKQREEDGTFHTVLNVPLAKIYTVEVSGVADKRLEICTSAGSFEFRGFNPETIYKFADSLQDTCDFARRKSMMLVNLVVCKYCSAKNNPGATYCKHCGALLG